MTLIVGMNLCEFVILAADTRTVWISAGDIVLHKDDSLKFQDIGIGLMTGSGYTNLLDAVKNRVANTELTHTDQISKIIFEEREIIEKDALITPDLKRIILDQTGWMFSYRTQINNKTLLRLAVIHPSIDNELGLILANKAKTIMPSGVSENQANSFEEILNSSMQSLNELPNIQENIIHNVSIIKAVMKGVSDVSETVSSSFYVGIHFLDNNKQVLPMISN